MKTASSETDCDVASLVAAITESSPNAIFTQALDGVITRWNPAAEQLFGHRAAEVVGKSVSLLLPPDQVHEHAALIERIRRGERINALEAVRLRKDGSLLALLLNIWPVTDAASRVVAASITARSTPRESVDAQALLAAIVESTDDAVISKHLDGTITSWNSAAQRIFGYEASQVIGGPVSILIPPERGQEELEILNKIRRGERVEHFETERIHKDGHRVEVSITISPLVQDGRIMGASNVARDITTQRKIQRELERERSELQVTLKSIGDGVIVSDLNGTISFMNPVAESLTGWPSTAALGQPLEAVFNIINETTRRRVENPATRALREGTVVALANHTILVSKDNTEYAINDTAAPIRDSAGQVLGSVLVFRDVSGLRAAEDFRARLAAIVQTSEDAIVSKDLHGKITSWNQSAARLFGYAPEEAIGRPISMIIPPERLAEETDILTRIRRGERIEHFETVRLRKDRSKVNVSISVSPLRDSEGNVIGASKIARDISERKRTERELIEAREALQRHSNGLEQTVAARTAELQLAYRDLEAFTYSVAHDLQAPVRRTRGLATFLRQELGPSSTAEQRELIGKIITSTDRMIKLVQDLLKLSHVGKQVLQSQSTPFNDLVNQAIDDVKPLAEGRNVEWHVADFPSLQCDPGLMTLALVNLLENALKYSRPRAVAQIQIGQKTIDRHPAIFIRDNGVGFDMSRAQKLFTPFERLHDDPAFEGSGVGLAIVERVIRRHGGRIWAEALPDQGATFFFTLGDDLATSESQGFPNASPIPERG